MDEISCKIALRWVSLCLTNDKSISAQVYKDVLNIISDETYMMVTIAYIIEHSHLRMRMKTDYIR